MPSRSTAMSSTIRTPWPSRSAPHHCIASQIDGSPKASPAWMVKCAFSRRRYSNASRCRVGGKPASAPAMSKPATSSIAESDAQLGDLAGPGGVPHRGEQQPGADPVPGRRRRRGPGPRPRRARPAPPRSASGSARCAARARTGSRRRPPRPRPGPARTPRPPGSATPWSASPRWCARTSPGTAPASRSRRTRRTSGRGRAPPWWAGRRSRPGRPVRPASRAAGRRPDDRAATPSGR